MLIQILISFVLFGIKVCLQNNLLNQFTIKKLIEGIKWCFDFLFQVVKEFFNFLSLWPVTSDFVHFFFAFPSYFIFLLIFLPLFFGGSLSFSSSIFYSLAFLSLFSSTSSSDDVFNKFDEHCVVFILLGIGWAKLPLRLSEASLSQSVLTSGCSVGLVGTGSILVLHHLQNSLDHHHHHQSQHLSEYQSLHDHYNVVTIILTCLHS